MTSAVLAQVRLTAAPSMDPPEDVAVSFVNANAQLEIRPTKRDKIGPQNALDFANRWFD